MPGLRGTQSNTDSSTALDVPCYGVDGCKGGWIYAAILGDQLSFGTVGQLDELLGDIPCAARVFVDIPIGLRDESGEGRVCDVQARRLLRPLRTSSVFNAPIRAILNTPDYQSANAASKRLSGKGLSRQSYNIIPKIREVDELMGSSDKARKVIREAHPEVCFCGLAGGHPVEHSKKTKEGFRERLALLSLHQPGIEASVEQALSSYARKVVAADDILDAAVCAVTAKMPEYWRTVPDTPELDSLGLPMEIVYCDLQPANVRDCR